jgi:hypothetical protein
MEGSDGPIAPENIMSPLTAECKRAAFSLSVSLAAESPVRSEAEVNIVPDRDAGNIIRHEQEK